MSLLPEKIKKIWGVRLDESERKGELGFSPLVLLAHREMNRWGRLRFKTWTQHFLSFGNSFISKEWVKKVPQKSMCHVHPQFSIQSQLYPPMHSLLFLLFKERFEIGNIKGLWRIFQGNKHLGQHVHAFQHPHLTRPPWHFGLCWTNGSPWLDGQLLFSFPFNFLLLNTKKNLKRQWINQKRKKFTFFPPLISFFTWKKREKWCDPHNSPVLFFCFR